MLSTEQFVRQLADINLKTSGLLNLQKVDLDVSLFLTLVKDTPFQVVPSTDGEVSIIVETGDPVDFSRQSGRFDMHTDGLYYNIVPEFVILFCVSPGTASTPTIFSDTRNIIERLKEHGIFEMLEQLEVVYIDKSGRKTCTHPLLQKHPRSEQHIINLGARAFIRPRLDGKSATASPLRSVIHALNDLFQYADDALILRHFWSAGDLILFDNNSYIHGREAQMNDTQRKLLRIWLSRSGINHQDMRLESA